MITPWPVPPSKREKGSCFTISTNLRRSLTVRKLKIAVTNCRAPIHLDGSPAISRIYRNLAHPRNRKEGIKFIKSEAPLHVSAINTREPIMRFCEAITAGASGITTQMDMDMDVYHALYITQARATITTLPQVLAARRRQVEAIR